MTIEQIHDLLVLQKTTFNTLSDVDVSDYQTLLSNLTSDSKVSNFDLELYNQAVAIKMIYDKMNGEKTDIADILSASQVMTGNWYRQEILKFQFGDLVQMVNNIPTYLEVDEEKQIIEFCAYEEDTDNDQLLLKVRRKDGTTLDAEELAGLQDYIEVIKGIGTKITVVNEEPDDVKLYFDVVYDAQVGLENLKEDVEAVLKNYIENLPFNSIIYMTDITDLLQGVDGVLYPRPEKISAKTHDDVSFEDTNWQYKLYAGYGTLVDVATTITYTT